MNEAMRDWVTNVANTHYLIGTVSGPHPFPMIVREFQRVISTEARPRSRSATADCRTQWLPAWVADRTRWASSPISSTTPRWRCMASRPVAPAWRPDGMRPRSMVARSACCTAPAPMCCRTPMAGLLSHINQRWAGLSGRWSEHACSPEPDVPPTSRDRRRGDGRVQPAQPHRGHHAGHRVGHALAGARRLGLRLAETSPESEPLILVNVSGRGDKDVDTAMDYFGIRGEADQSMGHCSERTRSCRLHLRPGHRGQRPGPGRTGRLPAGRLPSVPHSLDAMRAIIEGTDGQGADLVEIGMPYSDPMMDGLSIQHATTRRCSAVCAPATSCWPARQLRTQARFRW